MPYSNSLFYVKECSSTNDEILPFLYRKNDGCIGVYTFNQKKGRGQYGNSWQLADNQNLAFSFGFRADLAKLPSQVFNFHTAVGVARFLDTLTHSHTEIKWPNDLIMANKKIGGLLLEQKKIDGVSWIIVGIGINVLQQNFENLPKAGSILTQTGVKLHLHDLASQLFDFLITHSKEQISEDTVLKNLNENLYKKNTISVFEIGKIRQNGIIKKVDIEGFLWVDLENDGLRKFFHKEIELVY